MTEHEQKSGISRKKFIIFAICLVIFLVILFGGIFGFGSFINAKKSETLASFVFPPTEISATKAKAQDWQKYIESVGTVAAINGVNVTSQSSGKITEINFKSGQMVKKGDLLFKMDTSELEGQLKQNKANLEIDKITYDRNKELYDQNAVSKQTLDTDYANYQGSIGSVEATQAQINYLQVHAPFSGKIGIRQINLGEYFQAGSNAASLNQIDPIYVNFNITESDVDKIKLGQTVELTTSSFPGKTFKGTITAIDSRLSDDTLGLQVQATVKNSDTKAQLLPGMFTDVHVMLGVDKNVVVIPQNAITYTLYGNSIYILTADMKDGKPVKGSYTSMASGKAEIVEMKQDQYTANVHTIRVGETRGNQTEVLSGVKPGDIVVTSGQLKLKNGVKAVINNDVKLDDATYQQTEKASGLN
ncbi:efflux RND transporter periplasmic adaptor subunit [Thiotrichales bacterium 19X7-9]|nr:efflux RND transporter periplasmic adaptor subunit [Thiotrichales bacterium 19X7-9]